VMAKTENQVYRTVVELPKEAPFGTVAKVQRDDSEYIFTGSWLRMTR
jgi:hypothetical protein